MLRKPSLASLKGRLRPKGASPRLVVLVGDEGAIMVHLEGRKVIKRVFAPNPEPGSSRSITEWIESHPDLPVYVLLDVIDQNYVRHDLPPVSPLSVKKLVNRRLERDFAADDLKGALSLGRDGGTRRDWQYLLISVAQSPTLLAWFALLFELPNVFAGFYLMPVELQGFIREIAARDPSSAAKAPEWEILVTHNKVGGFRQVVLRGGKLIFTRLAQPLGDTIPEVIAGNVEQEVQNTLEYIKRLSYQEQAGLRLNIIVAQDIKASIDSKKFKSAETHIYTPYEVSELLELEQAALPADHFGDVVLAAFFATVSKPFLRLDTPQSKQFKKWSQLRMAAFAAAILVGAALGLSLAYHLYCIVEEYQAIGLLDKDKIATAAILEKIEKESKTLPDDIDRIIEAVSIYQHISQKEEVPFEFIAALGAVLDDGVRVKALQWASPNELQKAPAPGAPAAPVVKNTNTVDVTLEVEFTKNTGDPARFAQAADSFFTRLAKAFPDYDITHSDLPGVIDESETLQVEFGGAKPLKEAGNVFIEGQPIEVKITMHAPSAAKIAEGQNPAGAGGVQ